jgi:hypothetical protein
MSVFGGVVVLGILVPYCLLLLVTLYGFGVFYLHLGKGLGLIVPVLAVIVYANWDRLKHYLERKGFFEDQFIKAIWKVICVILGLSVLIGWLYSSGIFQ